MSHIGVWSPVPVAWYSEKWWKAKSDVRLCMGSLFHPSLSFCVPFANMYSYMYMFIITTVVIVHVYVYVYAYVCVCVYVHVL